MVKLKFPITVGDGHASNFVRPNPNGLPKQGVALQRLIDMMKTMHLFLYRGDIYFPHPDALVTKMFFLTAPAFLGHVIANKDFTGDLILHEVFLTKLLTDHNTTVIQQLQLDYDYIEVHQCVTFHSY